ncbi:MAG: cyclic pyranopterin monophosphate synthase MoaC [Thermodesulfovibrionia bacterium]|nr:cyclic pyranopterin monophosphate synthase MoaC [Thermodesulfovibrionia bacterium]MCK5286204.1 cyclic pyranopterin monophosphate synthase MoaC [Thermodesulfovibrionia bacterium]MCK5511798.1 cyclic pyranopterin monophosphate synthase MoaC [Thermodesulfovibrionia bacterium]
MKKLSHFNKKGQARMVDVSGKPLTLREAVATGSVHMKKQTLKLITDKKISKGDVFETARLAGIMSAKRTSDLIPLCHPLAIASVSLDFTINKKNNKIDIEAQVKNTGQTGVEMETLMAVSVAALTIYDMCKAVDRGIVISDIMLMEKRGGKSGVWKR